MSSEAVGTQKRGAGAKDNIDIERLLRESKIIPRRTGDLIMDAGVEYRVYSTQEAASFFPKKDPLEGNKTNQWLYWAMRPKDQKGGDLFIDPEGNRIEPDWDGDQRIFTLDIILDMATALYQRHKISEDIFKIILKRIVVAEAGKDWTKIVK